MKLLLNLSALLCAVVLQSQTTGPDKGHLVVVGGAMKSEAIVNEFIELAGGLDAQIIVIPTAAGRSKYSQDAGLAGRLKKWGLQMLPYYTPMTRKKPTPRSLPNHCLRPKEFGLVAVDSGDW